MVQGSPKEILEIHAILAGLITLNKRIALGIPSVPMEIGECLEHWMGPKCQALAAEMIDYIKFSDSEWVQHKNLSQE